MKKSVKEGKEFQPTTKQLFYLQAFTTCPLGSTKKEIIKTAGICVKTEWEWQQNPEYCLWFQGKIEEYMKASLPEIYRSIKRMAKNKTEASKLFLQRFDKKFTEKKEIQHSVSFDDESSGKAKELTDEELEKI